MKPDPYWLFPQLRETRHVMTYRQFHCSNTSGLCDRCGLPLSKHETGDYYCPKVKHE